MTNHRNRLCPGLILALGITAATIAAAADPARQPDASYPVVDTGQQRCYSETGATESCPEPGHMLFGQDAQYQGNPPAYRDNGDGTVTDLVTGLMWQKSFARLRWREAAAAAAAARTGGYADWRVPTIKELYSLMDFRGNQGSPIPTAATPPAAARPFIDTGAFEFEYGSAARYIDAQYISQTEYLGRTMGNAATFFGANFADGRIKGYPKRPHDDRGWYIRLVRGPADYGENHLIDNGDGTITDTATGLMWTKHDSGDARFKGFSTGFSRNDGSMNWSEALAFAEAVSTAGHDDWRLPNAKELHSILDYGRAPDVFASAAIDPVFSVTAITNEAGSRDFPAYWTSTSFNPGEEAVVIHFGRAMGFMKPFGSPSPIFLDVHGAGAQRTDPKVGNLTFGGTHPQGDVQRVYNFARPVRDAR